VFIVIIDMIVVVNSTLGSALPSNAIPYICKEFGITSSTAQILPLSMYLVGYVLGPLLFRPLSETYGRKIIMISTFILFTIFTMACALAPNFAALSVFRLMVGINASSPLSVTGGVYADIYADPVSRGRALSIVIGVCSYFLLFRDSLILSIGNLRGTCRCSSNLRVCLTKPGMALVILDRTHHCWGFFSSLILSSRDLRPCALGLTCSSIEKKYRKQPDIRPHGS
jgi:MFS family permease